MTDPGGMVSTEALLVAGYSVSPGSLIAGNRSPMLLVSGNARISLVTMGDRMANAVPIWNSHVAMA